MLAGRRKGGSERPPGATGVGSADEGIRLEYQLLRAQIADADKACVVILGVLISGSLTLVSFALTTSRASIAWLLTPFWLVGHMYLSEKRFMILKTAYYIRTELEANHPGLGWESWHQVPRDHRFLRHDPFYLETAMAALVMIATPVLAAFLASWDLGRPWFWLGSLPAIYFLVTLPGTIRNYKRSLYFKDETAQAPDRTAVEER